MLLVVCKPPVILGDTVKFKESLGKKIIITKLWQKLKKRAEMFKLKYKTKVPSSNNSSRGRLVLLPPLSNSKKKTLYTKSFEVVLTIYSLSRMYHLLEISIIKLTNSKS
jgi:hypothetical protein